MKIESLETVKDVQDKIISTKDSQISFLNDQIANIWTPITIVAGFIALVFGYVAWLNQQAQNKVKQAESLINQNQETATVAQEKLNQLEVKHKDLNDLATITITNQKLDMSIRQISITLDLSKNIIDNIFEQMESPALILTEEQLKQLAKLQDNYKSTVNNYRILSFDFNSDVISGRKFDTNYVTAGVEKLVIKGTDLYEECLNLRRELNIYE